MGNRTSKYHAQLSFYKNSIFQACYIIRNSDSQTIPLEHESKVIFKFIRDDGQLYFKINYNAAYYCIYKTNTYKEGDTQYIEIILNPRMDITQDSSTCDAVHLIRWHNDVKNINFNFDSTVN
jgi:hypothetical protein